jgi:hypothetical protein
MATRNYLVLLSVILVSLCFARTGVAEVAGIINMGPLAGAYGFAVGAYPASRHSSISYERVYRVHLEGELSTLWQTLVSATEIKVAPGGRYVAFIEGRVVTKAGEDLQSVLRVVDTAGESVKALSGVYAFDWAPDGESLVCVRGTPREDYPGFESIGTWITPLHSDDLVKIYDCGRDATWAGFDGNIYITHATRGPISVFRYNYKTGTLDGTPHKGIYFSPNGSYYYLMPSELELGVYRTIDDADVFAESSVVQKIFRVSMPLGWLDDERVVFAATDLGGTRCVIYNVESDTLLVSPGPAVLLESGALAVWDSGTVRTMTFSELSVFTDAPGAASQQEEKK